MNTRDELYDSLRHSAATSAEDPDAEARRLIQAYRAEVLREAKAAIENPTAQHAHNTADGPDANGGNR